MATTSKIATGTPVNHPKYGEGSIVRVITKSTGYIEVEHRGVTRKDMAFNYNDNKGNPLKSKPQSSTSGMSRGEKKRANDKKAIASFNAMSNIDKIKAYLLRVNNQTQGDRSSVSWKLYENFILGIQFAAKEDGDTFIFSITQSVIKWMKCSEKQAYVIAKYADSAALNYDTLSDTGNSLL